MQRPKPLQLHDKAVIISPAGKISPNIVEEAAAVLESWGLLPEIGKNALGEKGRFSGTVEQRLADLQHAFDDPSIRLALCSRGGYGIFHLLDKLDYSIMKRYPKWVIGYSDITALHASLQVHGIASIHGPMAKDFAEEGGSCLSVKYIKSILEGEPLHYEMPAARYSSLNRSGYAAGRLFGGNMTLLCGLLGTKYLRVPRKGILFIEDIGEEPYRVDRMIYQLKLAGLFSRISGFIVGQFTGYEEDSQMYLSLYESIREAVKEFHFPVCFDFPVGHKILNFPLIMGEKAKLLVGESSVLFKQ